MFELIPYGGGFGSLGRLRRDMDDLWSRFLEGGPGQAAKPAEFFPTVDVRETKDALELSAEIPGLKPEEIEVTLVGDLLTIKGEKKEAREKKEGEYHLVERRYGSFSRSFRLPVEVDRGKLAASHKDGVLTVTLPKAAKATAAKIEVKPA